MIIDDLKEAYIIRCSSDSEAKMIEKLHQKDMFECYGFCWTLEFYGPQIINKKSYLTYVVNKEILLATESICNKTSLIRSLINHISYFQKLRES